MGLLNLLLAPLLAFYFITQTVKKNKTLVNLIYTSLVFIFLTDLSNIYQEDTGLFLITSLLFAIGYQACYIVLFRIKGSRVRFETFLDVLKIIAPSLVFFCAFGIYFLDHPNTLEYILILISDLETTLLIILALFRNQVGKNYWTAVLGAFLLGITNILYLFFEIEYLQAQYLIIIITTYWLSHYFLIKAYSYSISQVEIE